MATDTISGTQSTGRISLAEKQKLFAKRLYETGSELEAVRAISQATNDKAIRNVIAKYKAYDVVQEELDRLYNRDNEFSRDDLKRRLLENLNADGITPTQRKDLFNLYEKTTRFEIEKDVQKQEKAILVQLDVGDAIEELLDGDNTKFDQFFDIKQNLKGEPTIRLKKKDLESKRQAYLCLLTLMRKQNVFASGM